MGTAGDLAEHRITTVPFAETRSLSLLPQLQTLSTLSQLTARPSQPTSPGAMHITLYLSLSEKYSETGNRFACEIHAMLMAQTFKLRGGNRSVVGL